MQNIKDYDDYQKRRELSKKAGLLNGRHYTTYVEEVKQLKRENRLNEAEKLLLILINLVEQESKILEQTLAPWYYEQLAIIYRKELRYNDELLLLERYCKCKYNHPKQNEPMLLRIEKVKILMKKSEIDYS